MTKSIYDYQCKIISEIDNFVKKDTKQFMLLNFPVGLGFRYVVDMLILRSKIKLAVLTHRDFTIDNGYEFSYNYFIKNSEKFKDIELIIFKYPEIISKKILEDMNEKLKQVNPKCKIITIQK